MNTCSFLSWLGIVAGGSTLPLAAVSLSTVESEEPQPRSSIFQIGYGYPFLQDDANAAQFADTFGKLDNAFGGLEHFYWENDSEAKWRMSLNGRWLFQPDQVHLLYRLYQPDKLYFTADYRQWTDFDSADGLYYPPTGAWFSLSPQALAQRFYQAKVTLQGIPSDTWGWNFAYSLWYTEGDKVSTRYGDDQAYQIARTSPRKLVPGLIDGKELVHTIDLSVAIAEEANQTRFRLHYQRREVDRRNVNERAALQPANRRFTTQTENSEDDLFTGSASIKRRINEKVVGSLGVAVTQLDGLLTGSRIFGVNPEAAYDPGFAALQLNDRGFLDLHVERSLLQWLMNGNLVYETEGNHRWTAGFRIEYLSTDSTGTSLDTVDQINWTALQRQDQEADMFTYTEKSAYDFSGFLDFRYQGLTNTVLYSRVRGSVQNGDLEETWSRTLTFPTAEEPVDLLDRATAFDRKNAFWEVGAHYYPTAKLKLSLQGYVKWQNNNYDYDNVRLPSDDYTFYPGYFEEQTTFTRDANARIHWQLFSGLKSVSRVDYQQATRESQDRLHPALDSLTRERILFNQSLTWTPHPRYFLTTSYLYSKDIMETPAPQLEGTFGGILYNLPNDYWQVDATVYCVLNRLFDLQVGYHFLKFDTYKDLSPQTVSYGSNTKQQQASARLIIHLHPKMTTYLNYQFVEQSDGAAPALRDVRAHLISGSLQYKF